MNPTRPNEGHPEEAGYALVAAVACIAVFAALALAAASAARMTAVSGGAEVAQAKAAAAADAGLAMAIHGLLARDPRILSALSGREVHFDYSEAAISVRIADENGKVPLNRMDEARATRLLEQAGLEGNSLAIARDSLLDWLDGDDEARPDGAEIGYYELFGVAPRNGALQSIDELAKIRGFSRQTVERLRPIVTVEPDVNGFDPNSADPRAIAVMEEGDRGAVTAIARAKAIEGQQTAFDIGGARDLARRPLTILIDARIPGEGHAHREVTLLLTRSGVRPYLIKSYR